MCGARLHKAIHNLVTKMTRLYPHQRRPTKKLYLQFKQDEFASCEWNFHLPKDSNSSLRYNEKIKIFIDKK